MDELNTGKETWLSMKWLVSKTEVWINWNIQMKRKDQKRVASNCHKITLAMFESRVDIWLGTILNSWRRGRSTYRITTFKDFRWTRKSMIFWLILGLYLKSSIPHCVTDTAQYWMTIPGPHILLSKPPACGQGLSPWWRWALPPRPPSPSSPRQR